MPKPRGETAHTYRSQITIGNGQHLGTLSFASACSLRPWLPEQCFGRRLVESTLTRSIQYYAGFALAFSPVLQSRTFGWLAILTRLGLQSSVHSRVHLRCFSIRSWSFIFAERLGGDRHSFSGLNDSNLFR